MKTPVTLPRIRQHLAYSWWKYVLLVLLCVLGWSLIFDMTAPRAKEEEKLELYLYGYGDTSTLDAYVEELHQRDFPNLLEMSAIWVPPDETNGTMVLSTRLAAGEGDLLLLPRSEFNSYAAMGMYEPLEELPGLVEAFEQAGINLERAWRKNSDTGERHLYGVPVGQLPIFKATVAGADDAFLGIRVYNGNEAEALRLFAIILREQVPGAADSGLLDSLCVAATPTDLTE